MRKLFERYPNRMRRIIEISIPLFSYALLSMPIWLSLWHPALVAYLLITFNVYWFWKAMSNAYYATRSFLTIMAHTRVDWLSIANKNSKFSDLYHAIIIPEYQEPIHILERTIEAITKQEYPSEKIIIVLAQEEKDAHADDTARILYEKYAHKVGHFYITKHRLTAGEVAGKSSNMAFAGKILASEVEKIQIQPQNVTVTSCDADALLHPKYLANIAVKWFESAEPYATLYQGAILFYTNIWRIPLPSRVMNTLWSFYNVALLSQMNKLINFSTYTLPLSTAIEAGYWGVDVIPEDQHLFFRVYFNRGQKVKVQSIFLPILTDAAESHNFWKTVVNQYEQSKRWAWGISDLPFIIRGMIMHGEIPLSDRLPRLYHILEHHILWPTNWFLLTVGSIIPPLINPTFGRTALGHNLSQISSSILTVSLLFMIFVIIIDIRLKPPRPKDFSTWKLPFLLIQWITVPFVSLFLSAIPGLDAHTRLMLGKRLEYRVTEKV